MKTHQLLFMTGFTLERVFQVIYAGLAVGTECNNGPLGGMSMFSESTGNFRFRFRILY